MRSEDPREPRGRVAGNRTPKGIEPQRKEKVRHRGIEPRPPRWQRGIITTRLMTRGLGNSRHHRAWDRSHWQGAKMAPPPGLEPGTYRLTAERSAN
jgi:hypothetical protein